MCLLSLFNFVQLRIKTNRIKTSHTLGYCPQSFPQLNKTHCAEHNTPSHSRFRAQKIQIKHNCQITSRAAHGAGKIARKVAVHSRAPIHRAQRVCVDGSRCTFGISWAPKGTIKLFDSSSDPGQTLSRPQHAGLARYSYIFTPNRTRARKSLFGWISCLLMQRRSFVSVRGENVIIPNLVGSVIPGNVFISLKFWTCSSENCYFIACFKKVVSQECYFVKITSVWVTDKEKFSTSSHVLLWVACFSRKNEFLNIETVEVLNKSFTVF